MIIAVTGGIGSGKSTISRLLASNLQAELLSADKLANEELLPGRNGLKIIEERWGERFVTDGIFNRPAMREAAFTDEKIRYELEGILHPLVYQSIEIAIDVAKEKKRSLVAEIPLLFENNKEDLFDTVVVSKISEKEILKRVSLRDKRCEDEIRNILKAQLNLKEKELRADYLIDNSGTFCSTMVQVLWLCKVFTQNLI